MLLLLSRPHLAAIASGPCAQPRPRDAAAAAARPHLRRARAEPEPRHGHRACAAAASRRGRGRGAPPPRLPHASHKGQDQPVGEVGDLALGATETPATRALLGRRRRSRLSACARDGAGRGVEGRARGHARGESLPDAARGGGGSGSPLATTKPPPSTSASCARAAGGGGAGGARKEARGTNPGSALGGRRRDFAPASVCALNLNAKGLVVGEGVRSPKMGHGSHLALRCARACGTTRCG